MPSTKLLEGSTSSLLVVSHSFPLGLHHQHLLTHATTVGWNKHHSPNEQQDAEEYLRWLLTTLQTHLPAAAFKTLSSLFDIHVNSTVACAECGHQSTVSDTQTSLQPEIPHPSGNSPSRLTDYIGNSLRETVDGFVCPGCEDKAPKRRTFTLTSAPPILIVQQKRFTYDMRRGTSRKLTHHVKFGEWLDLSSHSADGSDVRYRLVGVVNHAGSLSGGHYVTVAKGPDAQWREMNDHSVRAVGMGKAMDLGGRWTPYLLYYERFQRLVADV